MAGRLARRPHLGVAVEGTGPGVVGESLRWSRGLGLDLARITTYVAWQWGADFPVALARRAARSGVALDLTWEPWDPRGGTGRQAAYPLADLSAHDAYVERFARGAAEHGGSLTVRFGHEMNGTWYPWSAARDCSGPRDYAEAFRRVRRRFEAQGATNVRWNWCPNVMLGDQARLLADCYPGDEYVDEIGVDGYATDPSTTPTAIFGPTLDLLRSLAPDKRLVISETGVAPGPARATWIASVARMARDEGIDALTWFEIRSDDRPDWRLADSASSRRAARNAFAGW